MSQVGVRKNPGETGTFCCQISFILGRAITIPITDRNTRTPINKTV